MYILIIYVGILGVDVKKKKGDSGSERTKAERAHPPATATTARARLQRSADPAGAVMGDGVPG